MLKMQLGETKGTYFDQVTRRKKTFYLAKQKGTA